MSALKYFLLLLLTSSTSHLWAAITPLALTGDTVPGVPGASFATFGRAELDATGRAAFVATLEQTGGITAANDKALLSFDGALSLNAQTGSGNVTGVAGADYADFQEFTFASSGELVVQATLVQAGAVTAANREGYWRFVGGTNTLVVRTGTDDAPGVGGGKFVDLGAVFNSSATGTFAFRGQLALGGSIHGNNDSGVWHYDGDTGTPIALEDTAAHPVAGAKFASFSAPSINTANESTVRATMQMGGSISTTNRAGVWKFSGGTGELLARTGSGNVPGSSSNFTVFTDPVINESGQVAFRGNLATGQQGLWLYTGTTGANLSLSGGEVSDLPGANFDGFGMPLLTNSGQVVAVAGLEKGVGGITFADSTGLWLFDQAFGDKLLARQGVGSVPDITGASYEQFQHIAGIGDTGVFVQATLQPSPGIVDATNDQGIWYIPFDGTPELLVRTGDELAGRTIAELSLPTAAEAASPADGISNANGELLFKATFTNGDSGLFLYSTGEVEYAPADFNLDGFVDGDDLHLWQEAYGTSTVGDADSDGDTDGIDFLIWQRQYTGPAAAADALAVPEPGVSILFMFAAVAARPRTLRVHS